MTRQRNTKNVPIVESTQKVDKPILGIIDNQTVTKNGLPCCGAR